jgi:hypothetical protein
LLFATEAINWCVNVLRVIRYVNNGFSSTRFILHVTHKNIDPETARGVELDLLNELNRSSINRTDDAENLIIKAANVTVAHANRRRTKFN